MPVGCAGISIECKTPREQVRICRVIPAVRTAAHEVGEGTASRVVTLSQKDPGSDRETPNEHQRA